MGIRALFRKKNNTKHASANHTKGKIYLNSSSLTNDGVWIGSPPYFKLDENIDTQQLGEAILDVLNSSKTGIRSPKTYTNLGEDFLKAVGLKSFSEIQQVSSKHCSVNLHDEFIEFVPYQNFGKNKGFGRLKINPIESIIVPNNSSHREIGEALLKGFEASFFKKENV